MWVRVLILLVSVLKVLATDTCGYKRFASSFIPQFVTRNNSTATFRSLLSAKDSCDQLGEVCFGVVLVLHRRNRLYVLGSSSDLRYTSQAVSWRKTCPGNCDFVLGREHNGHSLVRVYREICPSQRAERSGGTWQRWSSWGQCSQSCGRTGTKRRVRQCRVTRMSREGCAGSRTQVAPCNYARKCPRTLSDVYGIDGPEGIAIAGRVPIYSSCIRTEAANRTGCGNAEGTTSREKCRQFDCCYINAYTGQEQGPRCYHPVRIYGGAGPSGWSIWNNWSVCSKSCRNGTRSRNRVCTGGLPGSILCPATDTNIEVCSLGACPCDVNPCHNGGECVVDGRIARGYRCQCPQNFIGKHCDFAEPILSCGNDSISVAFDKRVISDEGLLDDMRLIHFQGYESSLCYATLSSDGTQYKLSIPPPIDSSCGSTVNVTGAEYTIRNKVLWRLTDQSATATVVLLDLACVYDKKRNMTTGLGFGIQPTVRTLSEQTGHATFQVDMTMYRDGSYTTGSLISSSPTIAEGEILYVAVDLVALSITNQQNEVLVLDRCYATDTTAQRRHIYDFIINGCPSNPAFTLVMENGQSAQAKWAFRVFEWAVQSVTSDVFIVCKVSVCDTAYEACLPTCGNTITPAPPQGGITETNSTDVDDGLESILNSLSAAGSLSGLSDFNRRKRDVTNKNKKLPLRNAYPLRRNKARPIASDSGFQVFVSKRISVIRPDDRLNGFMQYPFGERERKRGYLTSHVDDTAEDSACGLTSFVMVGCASIVTYVIIAAIVKNLMARMRR